MAVPVEGPFNDEGVTVRGSVDTSLCQGHLRCHAVSPDYFDMDDEGFAVLLVPEVNDEAGIRAMRAAADGCPERAIKLED